MLFIGAAKIRKTKGGGGEGRGGLARGSRDRIFWYTLDYRDDSVFAKILYFEANEFITSHEMLVQTRQGMKLLSRKFCQIWILKASELFFSSHFRG